MSFTKTDMNRLKSKVGNEYLRKSAEDKHTDFAKVDPFPDVPDALLNSADIVKYVLTTGIIEPFVPENLLGATYKCEFSGEYIFWDAKRIKHKHVLSNNEKLIIKPNSIVFLGIKPLFYIPEYMVLRFNLRVKNVYKGLLLGTGPVVDPGYTGKLFIPLHNLTSNEYFIKSNAALIDIEFTKLSKNSAWALHKNTTLECIVNSLDFTSVPYIPKDFPGLRSDMDRYIEEALTNDQNFAKEHIETPFVNSSMEEEIKRFDTMQELTDKKIKELEHFRTFLTLTIVSVIIAGVSLLASTCWYFSKATELSEATKRIDEQRAIVEQQQKDLDRYKVDAQTIIDDLKSRVNILEDFQTKGGETQ
ncbi:hypothetical protein FACS1894107_06040 [Planctomycetales bacterium]|nr:hypothetical protein FACS1894107_06040 [Planctomycetales bacterium]